ncbi:MAG: PA0069 family radical SAM protein [Fuerstiella sp.]|nr:PA0069 family radical SAM protein [Fuerstiella sp.]
MDHQKNYSVVGRGANLNQTGRFESIEIHPDWSQMEHDDEWYDQVRRPKTRYFEDVSCSVISENDSPDIPFRFSLNPYRGCLHGCSYCYARPSHEYLGLSAGLDFETRIFVKRNAASLFRRWLCRRGYEPAPVMMSGITDCYQPAEKAFQITQQCLEVAAESCQPMSVITKNALVCRDVEMMARMASQNLIQVGVSITSLDQSLTKLLEPGTSAPAARLRAVKELTEAGVPVHVMIAPVIPGLNDSEIPAILQLAADAGVRSSSYILLRLPHSVKDLFTEWLKEQRPNHAGKVLSRLLNVRDGKLNETEFGRRMRGAGSIADQIAELFRVCARRSRIDCQLPTFSTADFRPPNGQGRLF